MSNSDAEKLQELQDAIAEVLFVITDVALGDYGGRLEAPEHAHSARSALYLGINQMIEALKEAREQQSLAVAELEEKLLIISRQAEAIRELSVPVLKVWDEVLVMPIIGAIDNARAADLRQTALNEVSGRRAPYLIMDVTGVELVDTATANHLLRVVEATGLLGARCVLTGIRPGVARTLVGLGVDLSAVTTFANLEEGLKACLDWKGEQLLCAVRERGESR